MGILGRGGFGLSWILVYNPHDANENLFQRVDFPKIPKVPVVFDLYKSTKDSPYSFHRISCNKDLDTQAKEQGYVILLRKFPLPTSLTS